MYYQPNTQPSSAMDPQNYQMYKGLEQAGENAPEPQGATDPNLAWLQGDTPTFLSDLATAITDTFNKYGEAATPEQVAQYTQLLQNDPAIQQWANMHQSATSQVSNADVERILLGNKGAPGPLYTVAHPTGSTRDSVRDAAIAAELGETPLQYEEDQILRGRYPSIVSAWKKYMGTDPTHEQLLSVIPHGSDASSWESYIRAMPSHLAGINLGQYTDLKATMDSESINRFGYASNDNEILTAYNSHMQSANEVKLYYDELFLKHSISANPPIVNAAWQAADAQTQAVWNQPPSPAHVQAIWQAAGSPGETQPTDAMTLGEAQPPKEQGNKPT